MNKRIKPAKTYSVWGYDIPAASLQLLAAATSLLTAPLEWLAASWWITHRQIPAYAGFAWIFIWLDGIHFRNVVVRKAVKEGLHDPLYSRHLRRMREPELINKLLIRMYVCAVALFAAVVGLKEAGIDMLQSLGLPLLLTVQRRNLNHRMPQRHNAIYEDDD